MNNMNDNRSKAGLVERYIGTAYDTVKFVADNMEALLAIGAMRPTDHNLMLNRGMRDQHPQDAITNLVYDLAMLQQGIDAGVSGTELDKIWLHINGMPTDTDMTVLLDITTKLTAADIDIINTHAHDRAELGLIIAEKAEQLALDTHVNDTNLHLSADKLTALLRSKVGGFAPLEQNLKISSKYLTLPSAIDRHTFTTISNMITAAEAARGTSEAWADGEASLVYGETDKTKNGEYVLVHVGENPYTIASFDFLNDHVVSHTHDDIYEKKGVIAAVNAKIEALAVISHTHENAKNPHSMTAHTLPSGTDINSLPISFDLSAHSKGINSLDVRVEAIWLDTKKANDAAIAASARAEAAHVLATANKAKITTLEATVATLDSKIAALEALPKIYKAGASTAGWKDGDIQVEYS